MITSLYIINILPIIIIVESVIAAAICFYFRCYGSGLYWLSAAAINISAVFLIKRFG